MQYSLVWIRTAYNSSLKEKTRLWKVNNLLQITNTYITNNLLQITNTYITNEL